MKVTSVVFLAAAGSFAVAQPHKHQHQHGHVKRVPDAVTDVVPGPTVYAFELNGQVVDEKKACEGISSGHLKLGESFPTQEVCGGAAQSAPPSAPTSQATSSTSTTSSSSAPPPPPASSSAPPPSSSSTASSPPAESSSAAQPPIGSGSIVGGAGVDRDFPDGQLDCSHFPLDYGALHLGWLGLGGWSGIQQVQYSGPGISHIDTVKNSDTCPEGALCSYACPAGYQKSQWPSKQGNDKQSVGGIECRNGKLYLTNATQSKKLCMKGTGGVSAKNSLGKPVSVCRTDYPGTESMTVPLGLENGQEKPMTCPDAANYYKWVDKPTSAQYYLNPAGVPVEEACQWGDGKKPIGNWAPIVLGVGRAEGVASKKGSIWLSISQNKPTSYEKLDFKVKIVGAQLSGTCEYKDGSFHSVAGVNKDGCTVELLSGEAYFEFTA